MRSLEELEQDKVTKADLKKQLAGRVVGGEYGSGTSSTSASMSKTNPVAISSFFAPTTTPGSQPPITLMLKKNEKEQAHKLLGKFLVWSDITFSVARNNTFFQPIVDDIAVVGPRYKIPSYDDSRGHIL